MALRDELRLRKWKFCSEWERPQRGTGHWFGFWDVTGMLFKVEVLRSRGNRQLGLSICAELLIGSFSETIEIDILGLDAPHT